MIIPETILYNVIESLFQVVRDDWEANTNKAQTILHDMFYKDDNGDIMRHNKFVYYDQAQAILLRTNDQSRRLECTVGYNTERVNIPTIHIILPEEDKGDGNGIGFNEGDYPTQDYTTDYREVYNYVLSANYNLLVTSDNSGEVILIYNFLKYCFVSLHAHLENMNLQNIRFGGADLQMQNDLVPTNVFHRTFRVGFAYQNKINDLFRRKFITAINYKLDEINGVDIP
jgi:hypothetical protein